MKRPNEEDLPGPSRYPTDSPPEPRAPTFEQKRQIKKEEICDKVYQQNFDQSKLEICDPFRGTIGRRVNLLANCFNLKLHQRKINIYEVSIEVTTKSGTRAPKNKLMKRDLFWSFLMEKQWPPDFNIYAFQVCYDDEKALFTTQPLQGINLNETKEYLHKYNGTRGRFDVVIKMTYKSILHITGENSEKTPLIQYIVQNVVTQFRRIPESEPEAKSYFCMGKDIIRIGLTHTYKPLEVDIISRLFEGLSVRVKTGNKGQLYLITGLIHRLLVQMELPVLQFYALLEHKRVYSEEEWNRLAKKGIGLANWQIDKFNKYFKGLDLKTNYEPVRHYIFKKLSSNNALNTYFKDADGKRQNIEEYYNQKYGISLKFPNLPLIQMAKPNVFIPIELCELSLKPQRVHGQLSPDIIASICKAASKDPRAYFDRISYMTKKAIFNEKDRDEMESDEENAAGFIMNEFGVELELQNGELRPMRIERRQLPAPLCPFEDREVLNKPVLQSVNNVYLIPCTANQRRFVDPDNFVYQLVEAASSMGQEFVNAPNARSTPRCSSREFNSIDDVKRFIKDKMHDHSKPEQKLLFLFLFIIGENSDNLYSWIKNCGDNSIGVYTQCVNGAELEKKFKDARRIRPMCKNLTLKIITRLGGYINEIVEDRRGENPCNSVFSKYTTDREPTLFLGVFSTKAQADEGRDTIVSLVFNINAQATKFVGVYGFDEGGIDFIDEIDRLFYDVLSKFEKKMRVMPSKVLLFRSGISDSIIDFVSKFEVDEFKKAWNRYLERHNSVQRRPPNILYSNVDRTHKIRCKQEASGRQQNYGRRPDENIPKGTVLDNTPINSPSGNDFYLNSHKGILGTSKPAHYEIKHNEWNDVKPKELPNDLQAISFSLCHLVQRSVQSVSVPAPVYYSRLLSDRVLQYLRTERDSKKLFPNREMASTTYFT